MSTFFEQWFFDLFDWFFHWNTCIQWLYITSIESGFGIWGMQLHVHASAHAYKIRDVQKKAHLVWLKKLQDVWQIARLQRFLFSRFYKIQRSYEKIMCICYFIGSVVKIVLYLYFLYTKDERLQQIKKKHEWWNNCFSYVFTYCLNLKTFASLFFLIQDNFMF